MIGNNPPSKFPFGITAETPAGLITLTLRNPDVNIFRYFRANNSAEFRQELRDILGPREEITADAITALGFGAPIFHWTIDNLYSDEEA